MRRYWSRVMAGLEGQIIGGCRIIRRLGGGGMGEVYLAEQISLSRQVAIKLVRPEGEALAASGGPSPAERFAREARAIASMEHPHILPVYDFGEQAGLAYLVMAYAPNGSLQEALTPGQPLFRFGMPLSLDLAGVILDQAAQALQHAHDRGVLHRDVKPANFLMGASSPGNIHLLLADFGLAKFTGGAANSVLYTGTAAYSAPEQIQNRAVPASDQYSLAAMLYLLLCGRLPFQGGLTEIVSQQLMAPVPSLHALNPAVPPEVETVILQALAKHPEERWPGVIVFAAAYREAYSRARRGAGAVPVASPLLAQPLPGAPVAAQASPPFSPPLAPTQMVPPQQLAPDAGATQVAGAMPGGAAFPPPVQPMPMPSGRSADDSFVAVGPLPLPPALPLPRSRRSWGGWAALAAGVGLVLAIILVVTLVMGHPGGNGGPGSGGNGPGVTSGAHIKSLQTGRNVNGDPFSCTNQQIAQPTTSFRQSEHDLWIIFTAVNDGNPNASAGTALIDSHQQIVTSDGPLSIDCPGTGTYSSVLTIDNVPPGQYVVGVFYTESDNLPQQPEVTLPVTISG
jgi:hypothetical protein